MHGVNMKSRQESGETLNIKPWLIFFGAAFLLGAVAGIGGGLYVLWQGAQFKDLRVLEEHKPKQFTRVYGRNGTLIDIISSEKRIILDFEDIPKNFVNALVATEDKDFFNHFGVSPLGILSAIKDNLFRDKRRGASTLTQQLVKNITKDSRFSYKRKLKEQFLAVQIETRFTKEEIFAKYVNEVPFGNNQFGIEAAATYYFGKSVGALNLVECATLAGIPQAPSRFDPYRHPESCLGRRNIVLGRMADEGLITSGELATAKKIPLEVVDRRGHRSPSVADHFVDKVRNYLFEKYGEEKVRNSGWDVITTLDMRYQQIAEKALRESLKEVDKRLGYRHYDCPSVLKGESAENAAILDEYFDPSWHVPFQEGAGIRGVVMAVDKDMVEIRIRDQRVRMGGRDFPWVAKHIKDLSKYFKLGDTPLFTLALSSPADEKAFFGEYDEDPNATPGESEDGDTEEGDVAEEKAQSAQDFPFKLVLDQEPDIEGAFVAIDPRSGDLLAMVGGYDYRRSKFNRAEQALRQVGSAFKPFVFGAALEQGYTLSDTLFDEPTLFIDPRQFEVNETGEIKVRIQNRKRMKRMELGLIPKPKPYQPHNYYNRYMGEVTLRNAIAQSLNIVSVKLLNSIGYDNVLEYINRMKIDVSNLQPYPSLALGSMEMTLQDMVYAYGTFAQNGVRYEPRFISMITDIKGRVIEDNPPKGEQVISPQNAYLVTSALTSVIDDPKGTARRAHRLNMPVAGKTGTTNDYTNGWFIGYTPDLAAGAWVGRDLIQTIGRNSTGSNTALPIWLKFFQEVRNELSQEDFVMPENLLKVPVDKFTGKKVTNDCDCNHDDLMAEVFIKGTEPTDLCTQGEKERLELPWYLQKRSYDYDPGGDHLKPAWVNINDASQQRALGFLRELRDGVEQAVPEDP